MGDKTPSGPWRKAPLCRPRPVDALMPIRRTTQTGSCSRCRWPIRKDAVRLADGLLAHKHHFHDYDITH